MPTQPRSASVRKTAAFFTGIDRFCEPAAAGFKPLTGVHRLRFTHNQNTLSDT